MFWFKTENEWLNLERVEIIRFEERAEGRIARLVFPGPGEDNSIWVGVEDAVKLQDWLVYTAPITR